MSVMPAKTKWFARAGGYGPDGLGPVIGRAVPDHGKRAIRELGAQPMQHVDRVLAIGARTGPKPHLALVVEVKAVDRDLGRKAGRGGGHMEALAALAPAEAKADVLADVRLVEVGQHVPVPLSAVQHGAQLFNGGAPPGRIGTAEQLPGRLPRQVQPVQGSADRLRL